MIEPALKALGIDPVQWRALVAAYIRMDLRGGGGPGRQADAGRMQFPPVVGLLLVVVFTSVALAIVGAVLDDPVLFAVLLTTYGALNTAMVLLVDFTGLVVSPDDYRVLGCRPVSSRTFFAARLSALLAYVLALGAALALLPALSLGLIRRLGVAAAAATVAAVLLCDVAVTVLVIVAYSMLIGRVHPRRLTRALSYLQLLASLLFLGGYFLATLPFQHAELRHLSLRDVPWLWANPAAWFASFVAVATGRAEGIEWTAAAAAIALTAACVPLAAGRFSLHYSERLAEMTAASEPPSSRRSVMTRIPGFARGEGHAIALLVRAQFRYDNRFRLAILSILPLTVFYIALGLNDGALADPFASEITGLAAPLYFAVLFLPMTLHASLNVSDSWRAAWVFFAAPSDPAKLIVAAKNFVALWFLGGYSLMLAALWSVFYDRVWHAFAHALVVGLIAHLLLQAAAIVRPAVPFAAEPRQAQRTSQLFVLFLAGGIVAGLLPTVLPFVYSRTTWTAGMLALIAAVTAATEYALRLRAREAVMEMEFRA